MWLQDLRSLTPILLLLLVSAYYAWRYSRMDIDPDWAIFNLWGFTGARYGRDFLDCKSPAIHLWYLMLAKIVGKHVRRVRFLHHLLVSLPAVALYLLTHSIVVGLGFLVLVNSGFLLSFHGNVGQQPAGLIAIALVIHEPWTAALLWGLAVFFEPKLAPSMLIAYVLGGWWAQLAVYGGATALLLLAIWKFYPAVWGWLVEANITITGRITKMRYELLRKGMPIFTEHLTRTLSYFLPWLVFAVAARPDLKYWLPALAYMCVLSAGIAVRANHLLPLIPWLALAGMPASAMAVLVVAEWLSSGLYLGNLWERFYSGLKNANQEARETGEYLRDKPGRLWVNGYQTGVYIYAQKPPIGGLTEQIEIVQNAKERVEKFKQYFKRRPAEWVVKTSNSFVEFNGSGYKKEMRGLTMELWRCGS